MYNNINTNNVEQTDNSNQTQNSNLPRDYFELIVKHYKAIISTIITAIPLLGTILTLLLYLYQKNYLAYFGVSEDWIQVELSKSIFNLIYTGCIVVIMLLPNTIALAPLLFEKETKKKIKFEFFFTLICSVLILLIAIPIKLQTNLSYSKTLIILGMLWIMMFGMPVIISLFINIINGFSLIFLHPRRTFIYLRNHRRNLRITTLFQNIANGIDKMNKFLYEPPQSETAEEHITNKNKAFFILIIFFFVLFIIMVLCPCSWGTTKAYEEKSFKIIKLNDTEEYNDLKENPDGDNPYIISNKRYVNAKVVIAQNDDCFLVANAYIDNNSNPKLYIFSNEQTSIEKNDVSICIMIFSEPPEMR